MRPYDDDLKECLDVLRRGGIILYPTDTIWGVGCDATNAEAVQRIYQLKRRDEAKSLLALVASPGMLAAYFDAVPSVAYDLIDCADHPLTLILDGAKNLAPNMIAPDGSLGLRVTAEPFTRDLCTRLKRPLVSTSANLSGQPAPATFADVADDIKGGVDYVVRYRQDDLTPAQPSSIVRLHNDLRVEIIRP